jgi:thiosulfate reductase cytochrome b subunit
VLPRKPKDPEKMALWRRKFGGIMTVLCPLIILSGIAQLFGVFR